MMNIDCSDEILKDFLVEAVEILEQLGEQLLELERDAGNIDLLNAVFGGFHTIKGGAGFVNLPSIVEVCHCAEDVFNVLRQGKRSANTELMDAVLHILDVLNEMFDRIRVGQEPPPANGQLLATLKAFAEPEQIERECGPAEVELHVTQATDSEVKGADDGDTTDRDFEGFLDALERDITEQACPRMSKNEEITEQEFEELLDQLHGVGRHCGLPPLNRFVIANTATDQTAPVVMAQTDASHPSDTNTEQEFGLLLDQLHGKGKAPEVPPTLALNSTSDHDIQQTDKSVTPLEQQCRETKTISAHSPRAALASVTKDRVPAKSYSESTVRIDTKRLDDIMNLVGELVLVRNRLSSLQAVRVDEQIAKTVCTLDMVTSGLQAAVMKTRMQPIRKVFGRFPRVVRDVARTLSKEVDLKLEGEETDLDKNLVEALADPLIHLVRNAVDHGIESPDEREQMGKSRIGKVVLAASQEGDHILLTIADDGQGMDPETLRARAVEKGLMDVEAASRLSEADALNLVFMAGFSTNKEISKISGRGVGMDVVKTRIEQLNGSIEILSDKGRGSLIRLKVPLTLAILSTLMVVLGNQRFALPLNSVDEILDFDPDSTTMVENQEVVLLRKKALPVFYLRRWLVGDSPLHEACETRYVVVVHVRNQRVGLVVDQLLGQEEVVIKPLGAYLQGLPCFAGATITGDGRIALIVDVAGLMKEYSGAR